MLGPFGNVTINYPCDIVYLASILPSNGQGELKCILLGHISHRNNFKFKQILLLQKGENCENLLQNSAKADVVRHF